MARSSVDDWVRFYDEVIAAGARWAPEAWYRAVGDAMTGALPANSPILKGWQRRVDELLLLQRAAVKRPRDERRIATLEDEIQRLIKDADEAIRRPRTLPALLRGADHVTGTKRASRHGRWLGAAVPAAAAVILVVTGLTGALHVYDTRLALRVDRAVEESIGPLRSSVVALERKFRGQLPADAVAGLLDELKQRAGRLRVDVNAASAEIAVLEQAVPAIGERLTRLTSEVSQGERAIGEAIDRIAALDQLAPELARMAAASRTEIESAAERERARFGELSAMLDDLKNDFETSKQQLAGARIAVDHELSRTAEDRASMRRTADKLKTSHQTLRTLREEIGRELAEARRALQEQVEVPPDDPKSPGDGEDQSNAVGADRTGERLVGELEVDVR